MIRTPRPKPWAVTGFLALAGALNYADRSAFAAVIPPVRADLHLSNTAVGAVLSLFLWSYAVGSPGAGILADRFPRSVLIVVSLALWSACMGLTGFSAGLFLLCACRIGLGLGESPFHPAAFALVADHHLPEKRARAMSLLSIGFQLGSALGGASAGYIAQRMGWRASFWILGGLGLVFALAAPFLVREAGDRRAGAPVWSARAFPFLCRNPSYLLIVLKQVVAEPSTWIFTFWLPLYYYETFHLKLGQAGLFGSMIIALPMAAGIIAGGWLSDAVARRSGKYRMVAFGACYLASAPFLLVFLGRPSFGLVSGCVFVWSLLRGIGGASERPSTCEVVPAAYRATAFGLLNTFATLAGALGAFLAGYFKDRGVGLSAAFASTAFLFVLIGLILVVGGFALMPRDMARSEALS